MLGAIFFKAENKIPDPVKLARIIKMINEDNWISLDADAKGNLYEAISGVFFSTLFKPYGKIAHLIESHSNSRYEHQIRQMDTPYGTGTGYDYAF